MSIAWQVRTGVAEETPPGWAVRRIGDLVALVNGYPFSSEEFAPRGDMPLVRIRDLAGGPFEVYVSGYVPPSVILQNGDVVIGMDGDFNVTTWDRGPAALNQRLCVLRPRPGIDIRFIAYALPMLLKIINDLTFSTTVKHLSSADILSERIPLPPLEEQRGIADFLDAETARLDRVYDCAVRQAGLLKVRRRSFIESVVDEVIVDPETVALRYIIRPSFESNRSDLQVLSVYRDYGVIPKDSRQDNFNKTPEDVSRYLVVRGGDLVVNKMKAWQGSIGVSIHKGIVSPDYLVARITTANVNREFLHYLLRSPRFTADYAVRSKGIRPSQWRLYWEDLAQIRIPIVPLQKQIEMVRRLKHEDVWVERSLSAIHRRLDLLAERRQALITAVVTGQIDVSTASERGVDIG